MARWVLGVVLDCLPDALFDDRLFLVFAVLTALNLHYQILYEERYLAQAHGLAYQAYCARTARYWTWRAIPRAHEEHVTG